MPEVLWDASALKKRYVPEPGRATVDAILGHDPPPRSITSYWGYVETAAVIRRKLNAVILTPAMFGAKRLLLRAEVLEGRDFSLVTIEDGNVLDGPRLIDHYNLNATDAAVLATFLACAVTQPPGSSPPILVATDRRLLRAGTAEGLRTLNPEDLAPADVTANLTI
jgi:predicted nucleic acid-binding protein